MGWCWCGLRCVRSARAGLLDVVLSETKDLLAVWRQTQVLRLAHYDKGWQVLRFVQDDKYLLEIIVDLDADEPFEHQAPLLDVHGSRRQAFEEMLDGDEHLSGGRESCWASAHTRCASARSAASGPDPLADRESANAAAMSLTSSPENAL